MITDIEEFRKDVLEEVNNNVMINQTNLTEEFLQYYVDQLMEAEELLEFDYYDIEVIGKNRKKGSVDGYHYDKLDSSISLFIVVFSNDNEMKTFTNTAIENVQNKILNYLDFVYSGYIIGNCEESSQEYQLATEILERDSSINKIKLYIFTDMILSKSVKDLQINDYKNKKVDMNIWDISRLSNIINSSFEKEDLIVNVKEFGFDGVECVKATESKEENYSSYLAVINGRLLADLYIRYGSRLLEGNVRSFLSVRGKINKEIRSTIRNNPELFFAYNNGIVVTATDIELSNTPNGLIISKFTNFQIINGGQTTASIANAVLQDKLFDEVKKVNVAMKLTVVTHERANEMIPNIARYANSQNKVDESDFFSNSPFHIRMEELSRKVYAPPVNGKPYETIWFYERAKGQYIQEQMKLSVSEKRKYKILKPKNQLIKKIDLAKYIMSYLRYPHIVSKGNQYNIRVFAGIIEKSWKKDKDQFNKYYYKKSIALAIIFRQSEKIVSRASWYENAYRANIVTYTIAIIFEMIDKTYPLLELDFLRIWNTQDIYDELNNQIEITSYEIFKFITKPIGTANVTEYCKKEFCWDRVKKHTWTLDNRFINTLIIKDENKYEMRLERKNQRENDLISDQTTVVNYGEQYWISALKYGVEHKLLNDTEISFIKAATNFSKHVPSDKQCKMILKVLKALNDEGFN